MAKGYVPVFTSVFDGTLGGRWPDSGVWLCLLALADADGTIDMTIHAITARIGVPVDQLRDCIDRFCAPDPESRSQEEEGRRLVLLDSARTWGWRVVNMAAYRRRASQRNEVAEGKNAERARRYRERHKVTASNGASRSVTALTGTQTETDTEKRERGRARRSSRVPADFSPDLSLASGLPGVDIEVEARKFRDWEFKTPRSDWPAAWRNWIQRCRETGNYAKKTGGGNGLPFASL